MNSTININVAQTVLNIEAKGILSLSQCLNDVFESAIELIQQTQGRVILMGIGKSGHIARKIASTLSSTGTAAFFVHPAEAAHGDLGMINTQDTVMILSKSGQGDELSFLMPYFRKLATPVIAITANANSPLAKNACHAIVIPEHEEACVLNLAPTTSSTMMLALGDAIAITLLERNAFKQEDFALRHPSGHLGKVLTTYAMDIMRPEKHCPIVIGNTLISDALIIMSSKNMGCLLIVSDDQNYRLLGIFTDGDLRRSIEQYQDWHQRTIADLMTKNPITAKPDQLATQVLSKMKTQKISALPVVSNNGALMGLCHIFDFYNMDGYETSL